MAGGGTEQGLQIHLQKVLNAWETGSPMPPPKVRLKGKDFGRGTPNHKGLGIACDLVDEAPGAIARLADFLAMQEERGNCCAAMAIETNTASHGQLHAAWAGVAYAWFVRHEQTNAALLRWWWSFLSLKIACEIPGAKDKPYPEPLSWGPGWRAKIGDNWVASNPACDLCLSLVLAAALPGEDSEPYRQRVPARSKKLWKDKYNNGPRALTLLKGDDLAALLPPPGWVPPLPYPFHVRRGVDGFLAWFDVPGGSADLARSAGKFEGGAPWVQPSLPTLVPVDAVPIDFPATSFERS